MNPGLVMSMCLFYVGDELTSFLGITSDIDNKPKLRWTPFSRPFLIEFKV